MVEAERKINYLTNQLINLSNEIHVSDALKQKQGQSLNSELIKKIHIPRRGSKLE